MVWVARTVRGRPSGLVAVAPRAFSFVQCNDRTCACQGRWGEGREWGCELCTDLDGSAGLAPRSWRSASSHKGVRGYSEMRLLCVWTMLPCGVAPRAVTLDRGLGVPPRGCSQHVTAQPAVGCARHGVPVKVYVSPGKQ